MQRSGRGGSEAAAVHAGLHPRSPGDGERRVTGMPCGRRRRELPVAIDGRHDAGRIFGAAEAAVVAAERAVDVAVLDVEIVAQDHAAVAQVGAQVEEVVVVAAADERRSRTASPACSRARRRSRSRTCGTRFRTGSRRARAADRVPRASLRSGRSRGIPRACGRRRPSARAGATSRPSTAADPGALP